MGHPLWLRAQLSELVCKLLRSDPFSCCVCRFRCFRCFARFLPLPARTAAVAALLRLLPTAAAVCAGCGALAARRRRARRAGRRQQAHQALGQQELVVDPGMVLGEQGGAVPARHLEQQRHATGVEPKVGRDVVHLGEGGEVMVLGRV